MSSFNSVLLPSLHAGSAEQRKHCIFSPFLREVGNLFRSQELIRNYTISENALNIVVPTHLKISVKNI